jgi:hypothetical protein
MDLQTLFRRLRRKRKLKGMKNGTPVGIAEELLEQERQAKAARDAARVDFRETTAQLLRWEPSDVARLK